MQIPIEVGNAVDVVQLVTVIESLVGVILAVQVGVQIMGTIIGKDFN
jgi:hypothetical protein